MPPENPERFGLYLEVLGLFDLEREPRFREKDDDMSARFAARLFCDSDVWEERAAALLFYLEQLGEREALLFWYWGPSMRQI